MFAIVNIQNPKLFVAKRTNSMTVVDKHQGYIKVKRHCWTSEIKYARASEKEWVVKKAWDALPDEFKLKTEVRKINEAC